MADKKISQLTNLTGANLAENDEFVLVDTSADETKAITFGELKTAFDTGTGFVRVTGDTMTGDLSFNGGDTIYGDNDKAIFGAGSDLQIYHDGLNSVIADAGTGNLVLAANDFRLQNATQTANMISANDDGAVTITYNGGNKLATTSTGIDVTGTVTADGLTVGSNDSIIFGTANTTGIYRTNSGNDLTMQHWGNLSMLIDSDNNDANNRQFLIGRNSQDASTALKIALFSEGGDISFYEDTGTTPKFFWDASAESLGIGLTSPAYALDIEKPTANAIRLKTTGATTASILLGVKGGATTLTSAGLQANNNGSLSVLTGTTSASERMRIDSSGNVGIGTSSPSANLHVSSTGDTIARITSADGNGAFLDLGDASDPDGGRIVYDSGSNLGFSTASTERMRITSTGNVGIGTSSPTDTLSVVGYGASGTGTQISSGTATTDARFKARTELWNGIVSLYDSGGNEDVRISASGGVDTYFNSGSNVGIGTSSPAASLHVANPNNATIPVFIGSNLNARGLDIGSRTGSDFANITFTSDDGATPLAAIGSVGDSFRIYTGGNTAERMRIDSSGKVGIRAGSGVKIGSGLGFAGDTTSAGSGSIDFYDVSTGALVIDGFRAGYLPNSGIHFRGNGAERMRIDSSGNLLVGKTSADNSAGATIKPDGEAYFVKSNNAALSLNRLSSDGVIQYFFKDTSLVGSIGKLIGNNEIYFSASGASSNGVLCSNGNSLIPLQNAALSDNTQDIGSGSYRWNDIFATNAAIQTSDRNEKQDIDVLNAAETRVAVACKGLLRKFRWKDAVAEKGDDARIHFGIIAQDLQDAFTAEGLDAGRYAMFISNTWWETQTDVPAVEAVEAVEATYDEDGNELTPAVEAVEAKEAYTRTDTYETQAEAPEGATERTRLGVRYPELLAFIIAAI